MIAQRRCRSLLRLSSAAAIVVALLAGPTALAQRTGFQPMPYPEGSSAGLPPMDSQLPSMPGSVGGTTQADPKLAEPPMATYGPVPGIVPKVIGGAGKGVDIAKGVVDHRRTLTDQSREVATFLNEDPDVLAERVKSLDETSRSLGKAGKALEHTGNAVLAADVATAAMDCAQNGAGECWGRAADTMTDAAITATGYMGPLGKTFETAYSITSVIDKTVIGGLTGKSLNDRVNDFYADKLGLTISDEEAFNQSPSVEDFKARRDAMKAEGAARYEATASTYQAKQTEHDRQQAEIARQQAEAQRRADEAYTQAQARASAGNGFFNALGLAAGVALQTHLAAESGMISSPPIIPPAPVPFYSPTSPSAPVVDPVTPPLGRAPPTPPGPNATQEELWRYQVLLSGRDPDAVKRAWDSNNAPSGGGGCPPSTPEDRAAGRVCVGN